MDTPRGSAAPNTDGAESRARDAAAEALAIAREQVDTLLDGRSLTAALRARGLL